MVQLLGHSITVMKNKKNLVMGVTIADYCFPLIHCCSQSADFWGSTCPARRYAGGPVCSCLATRATDHHRTGVSPSALIDRFTDLCRRNTFNITRINGRHRKIPGRTCQVFNQVTGQPGIIDDNGVAVIASCTLRCLAMRQGLYK